MNTRTRADDAFQIRVSTVRRLLLGAVLLVVLIVAFVLFRDRLGGLFARGASDQIDSHAYQAVFLTGGQVYFGHAESHGDAYLLRDVFYLSSSDPTSQNVNQLIKRGAELHGPKEPMIVPDRSVLFVENLRDDSEIVKAITDFKAGRLPTATPPAATPTPAPSGTARPSPTR